MHESGNVTRPLGDYPSGLSPTSPNYHIPDFMSNRDNIVYISAKFCKPVSLQYICTEINKLDDSRLKTQDGLFVC